MLHKVLMLSRGGVKNKLYHTSEEELRPAGVYGLAVEEAPSWILLLFFLPAGVWWKLGLNSTPSEQFSSSLTAGIWLFEGTFVAFNWIWLVYTEWMVDGLMLVLGVHVYSTKEFPKSGNGREYSPPFNCVWYACIHVIHTYMYNYIFGCCLATTVFMGKLLATGGMGDHAVCSWH